MPTREIRFYLSEDFATENPEVGSFHEASLSVLAERLTTFVGHLNTVLAKNTNLVLSYDPDNTTFVSQEVAEAPDEYLDTGAPPETHRFAVYVPKLSPPAFDVGATVRRTAVDEYAVRAGTPGHGWSAIWDPDDRTSTEVVQGGWLAKHDYAWQCAGVLHELAHIHGAGNSEYYNNVTLADLTGSSPNATEGLFSPGPYWSARQPIKLDPLIGTYGFDYDDVFDYESQAKFCALTRECINAHATIPLSQFYFNYPQVLEDDPVVVRVRNDDQTPVVGITVYQHRLSTGTGGLGVRSPAYDSDVTDSQGLAHFTWPSGTPQSNQNNYCMFAVPASGRVTRKAWIMVFDLHCGMHLSGPGYIEGYFYRDYDVNGQLVHLIDLEIGAEI